LRTLASVLAGLLALPLAALAGLCVYAGVSRWGLLLLLGLCLLDASLLLKRSKLALVALGMLLALGGARVTFAAAGSSLVLTTLPDDAGPRLVDRLVDEQDITLPVSALLGPSRLLRGGEGRGLLPSMQAAYREMRADQGAGPSPVVATLLGLERPDAFDTLVIGPRGAPSGLGLLFLHGFAGNFALPCWEIARAVPDRGAVVACPSVGFDGNWRTPAGAETVGRAIRFLRGHGVRTLILAGLSNGGIGASALAPRLGRTIDGLILISGVAPGAPLPRVPVLVLQGRRDALVPARLARAYARRAGAHARYVELDGDHFVLVERAGEARAAIADWIGLTLEGARAGR
jgi:pimeloyl-ACP methyl ester carboxylesterase